MPQRRFGFNRDNGAPSDIEIHSAGGDQGFPVAIQGKGGRRSRGGPGIRGGPGQAVRRRPGAILGVPQAVARLLG